jgi:serine/threonine protein kinase
VLGWADQLLGVLEYLHKRQPPIIHRDIKPHNLKLAEDGQIVLLDFGLAKGAAWQMSHLKSGTSIRGYTPSYAPPEQIKGTGTDARSDLYSIGATLYHLITGGTPTDALTRVMEIAEGNPDPLRPAYEMNSQVWPVIAMVLKQAMMLNREKRFSSATEMRKALREAHSSLKSVSDASTTVPPRTSLRWSR